MLYSGFFAVNFYISVVRQNAMDNDAVSAAIEKQYQDYAAQLDLIAASPEVHTALTEKTAAARVETNKILYAFSNAQTLKSYFVLMDDSGAVVCSNFNSNNQSVFAKSAFASSAISRMNESPLKSLSFVFGASVTSSQQCSYTLCRRILGKDGTPEGYIFFNLRAGDFQAISRKIGQKLLITDHYDNVIFTTLDQVEDPQDKFPSSKYYKDINKSGIIRLGNNYQYIKMNTIEPQGLNVYTLTTLELQVQMFWYGVALFLLLLIIMYLIIIVTTRTFSKTNSREISELMDAVEQLGNGNRSYELSESTSDEFQRLYDSFREMTTGLQDVMARNAALVDRRRQMEVKQLEEQFNPHFVFNVMETVRYQIDDDPKSASEMLVSFAKLMRYSINHGETQVPLETEIEYINDFLLLQKIRYNKRLQYSIEIPDELMECRVPKLLLQPVVENSVKHGFCPGRDLRVSIKAEHTGNNLRLIVADDGAGIAPERLAAINESFTMELNSDFVKHIGLYNVQKMLYLLYGAYYGVTIESKLGEGTQVVLTVPYEVEEEEC